MEFRTITPEGVVSSWWNVTSSDDYAADCEIGREYARQFIRAARINEAHVALPHIVSAFPTKLSGIEVGFLQEIAESLALLT